MGVRGGGGERGNYWPRMRFNGGRKTRGGRPPARYGQNWRRAVADRHRWAVLEEAAEVVVGAAMAMVTKKATDVTNMK